MALHKRANPFSKVNNDTGFGTNVDSYGGRFVNRDGTFNMRKEGKPFWERFSIYHTMLNMKRWKFISVVLLFYFFINLVYTGIYLLIGTDELQGIIGGSSWKLFKEVFFFSTETFTTVGYGRINPIGDGANLLASIEAMNGFLSFAIATGLFYGRFSKPKCFLTFSDHALISPFQDKTALIFRFVSYKDYHILTNVEVKVTIGLQLQDSVTGKLAYKYFELPLERNFIESMSINFTVVHPIDEQSPIYGFNWEDIKAADLELYVLVRAFDDTYSTMVLQRTSYTYDEIKFNKKFNMMYKESDDGKTTIVELHKLNEHKDSPL